MRFRKIKNKLISWGKGAHLHLPWYIIASLGFILVLGSGFLYIVLTLPSPNEIIQKQKIGSTLIFDRSGILLYKIYAQKNRIPVKLDELPKYVPQATIAVEDRNFYHHFGIDLKGVSRALFKIITHKRLEGGSTITQQLVKNTLLSPQRTIKRKIKEAILALAVESMYSKKQILEMYLNTVPYGGTAYGIEAASLKYFNKDAKDLDLAEAALLAGLPSAPTKYNPFIHPQLAKERQKLVLESMLKEGYITPQEAKAAYEEKLKLAPIKEEIKAPHFVFWIKDLLVNKYGEDIVNQGGLKVYTSLDYHLQEEAEKIVKEEIEKVKRYHITNGALLVTQPRTGQVLAMVGSADFYDLKNDGQVNVTLALRQPGSSIKPLTYALAMENGWTAATPVVDAPTCFLVPGQPPYCPRNYDGKFHGLVQLRFALANSYNIPAVKVMALDGLLPFLEFAQKIGLSSLQNADRYGLSLGLGAGEVRMVDMAVAYSMLANNGLKTKLNPIRQVRRMDNSLLEEHKYPVSTRVISSATAYIISHILLDNGARSAAFGPNSLLRIKGHQAVSVKTGTTNNMRDNWTIGYTQDYLVASWVGNNDNSPMSYVASGVTGASPIWNRMMTFLLKDKPDKWPAKPQDVVGMLVCSTSGLLPGNSGCPTRFEYFKDGTQPTQTDPGKQQIWVDSNTHQPAKPGQTDNLTLEEHYIVHTPFVKNYCLDCPHDNEKFTLKLIPDKPYTYPFPTISPTPN